MGCFVMKMSVKAWNVCYPGIVLKVILCLSKAADVLLAIVFSCFLVLCSSFFCQKTTVYRFLLCKGLVCITSGKLSEDSSWIFAAEYPSPPSSDSSHFDPLGVAESVWLPNYRHWRDRAVFRWTETGLPYLNQFGSYFVLLSILCMCVYMFIHSYDGQQNALWGLNYPHGVF